MTIHEANEKYGIPSDVLRLYESWDLRGEVKKGRYDSQDHNNLNMILTLRDIGFDNEEMETYMRLLLDKNDSEAKRLLMLNRRRNEVLDEIHIREKQIHCLDYLRHEIRKAEKEKRR